MDVKIEPSWKKVLQDEFEKPYFKELSTFVKQEYQTQTCFPNGKDIFNAFTHTPYDKVKVVILGQDPYHGVGQAHGLCFSVPDGIPAPPSLQNIFKELHDDMGSNRSQTNLTDWADQGVLLLNATLTVRAHQAGSHQKKGWETFTDAVIQKVSSKSQPVVFILWGSYARSKKPLIASHHKCLESVHPSPLSSYRGFFGSKPFSKTNTFLQQQGMEPIHWG